MEYRARLCVNEGKVGRETISGLVSHYLGSKRKDILIPPAYGMDFGAACVEEKSTLAFSTDPIYIDMSYPVKDAAWYSLHIIIGDGAVSGLEPSFLTLCWNLPFSMKKGDFTSILSVYSRECRKYDISIITGHTGCSREASFPILGAGTVICTGTQDRLLGPERVRDGDRIIATKYIGSEAASLVAMRNETFVKEHMGVNALRSFRSMIREFSVVEEALTAPGHGAVYMHDASERGVAAALNEMSVLCSRRMEISEECIQMKSSVSILLSMFKINPLEASSSGTLLIVSRPGDVEQIISALKSRGIESWEVGRVKKGKGVYMRTAKGLKHMVEPGQDSMLSALHPDAHRGE